MASKKMTNANPEVVGIDVGFGFTKVFPGNIVFPSVIAEYRERMGSIGQSDPMDNLILEVNGQSYLVGNLAKKEGGSATFDKDNQQRHLVCMLTSIVLAAGGDYSGPVVMGLPMSDLENKRREISLLKGTYEVVLSGEAHTVEITDVLVSPQGAASFYDLILNDEGKVVSSLVSKKIGIIDIGEKTLDFVVMDKSQFIMERSGGMDLGMHKAYLRLLKIIQADLGISIMPYQVRDYLPKVSKAAEHEYRRLANEIVDGISAWWNYRDFDNIYLTGGGGMALHQYVAERIKCDVLPDSQLSNARGYFKCGQASNEK